MSYSIEWYIENEIIYVHYSGTTTVDDMRNAMTTTKSMIDESPRQLVHVISDVGDVIETLAPKDALKVAREVGTHPRAGWSIVLREQSVVMKIGIMFGSTVLQMRNRAFDTMEETVAFLKTMDTTLNWDHVNQSVLIR